MRFALVTFLAATSSVALAQDRPQLTWEGYVSGSAILNIQDDNVDVDTRGSGSVERTRVSLADPLPAARQRIEMNVVRGSGRVNVIEQPTPQNNYTARVRIDPVGNRSEFYQIRFFWDAYANQGRDQSRRRDRRADDYGYRSRTDERYGYGGDQPGSMTWSGTVDHEALIEIRGQRANVRTVRGRPVRTGDADFTAPLPRSAADLRLEKIEGRGNVELVQEPGPGNNYAAIVRVYDEDDGADNYAFRLAWDADRDTGHTGGGILSPSRDGADPGTGYGNSMQWSGLVDGTVRVHVRGNQVWTTRVSGGPIRSAESNFAGSLPRADIDADVRKIRGRGDVDIVQKPDARNNYTLIFEIEDEDAGADTYEVEVTWR